jgi:hypothetical protein
MSNTTSIRLEANIEIPATSDFDLCAQRLNSVLSGFCLVKDVDCRFDEYPAYVADSFGVEIVLFGIPDVDVDEIPPKEYILQLSTYGAKSVLEWRETTRGSCLGQLLMETTATASDVLNLSDQLASNLRAEGIEATTSL